MLDLRLVVVLSHQQKHNTNQAEQIYSLFCPFVIGSRVGSHVVSVRIHCTEKWRTSFNADVLSKSK